MSLYKIYIYASMMPEICWKHRFPVESLYNYAAFFSTSTLIPLVHGTYCLDSSYTTKLIAFCQPIYARHSFQSLHAEKKQCVVIFTEAHC